MKLIALGDSLTAGNPGFLSPLEAPPQGHGDPRSQYGYWIEQRRPGCRVLNRGISGERTDQILKRYERDVRGERADALIVLAGTNDLYQGHPVAWAQAHLQQIYDRALEDRLLLVTCSVLPLTGATSRFQSRLRELNTWIEKTAGEHGFGWCDLYARMEDPECPGALRCSADGVHPDVEGYKRMGEAIATALDARINLKA